jgi:hypothetical protein
MISPAPLQESHAHLPMLGRSLSMLQLGSCVDTGECLRRVREHASSLARDSWVLGVGVRIAGWNEPRWPTREELADAAGGRPCVLMSFDYHCVVATARAMKLAGLRDDSPDPPGGVLVRDRSGVPTGVLLESAAKQAWNAAPEPAQHERPALVRAALDHLAALGYLHVHDLLAPAWLGSVLAQVRRDDDPRVGLYTPLDIFDDVARDAREWERPGLRLLGAKVFADGTLNSRTAWMLDPYADPLDGMPCGKALMSEEQLASAMCRTREAGLGLAVHAIGDAAVRATLNAWEACGEPARHAPRLAREVPALRIEHCEILDEADVPRFAELGVVCSVQPCHLLYDIEALRRALPHRLDRVLPLRELIDSGCRPGELLWFGSDVPIVRAVPGDSIQAAVRRGRVRGSESEVIAPQHAITQREAVDAFTPTIHLA